MVCFMINTRLSMSIHILSLVALASEPDKLNSEWIAGSINTNPVVVRRLMSALKKANLVKAYHGNKGLQLIKDPADITFFDILKAVDPENKLFNVHQNANIQCKVGRQIELALVPFFDDIQKETEKKLQNQTLQQVIDQMIRK